MPPAGNKIYAELTVIQDDDELRDALTMLPAEEAELLCAHVVQLVEQHNMFQMWDGDADTHTPHGALFESWLQWTIGMSGPSSAAGGCFSCRGANQL